MIGARALQWAVSTFGKVALSRRERACRFIEEAIELVHAIGLPQDVVEKLVQRVYERERGGLEREFGQAALTLELLATVAHVPPLESLAEQELARIQSIPRSEWDRRHAEKVAKGIANVAAGENS